MNDDARRAENDPGPGAGNDDPLERRLTDLGRSDTGPVDPRFADRLESSIRAMHGEPSPVRRFLVRPAVVLVAAVLAVVGIATVAVRTGDPDPIEQADRTVVSRPTPTATPPPTGVPAALPAESPSPSPTRTAPPTVTEATPVAPPPPVTEVPTPTSGAPAAQPTATTTAPASPTRTPGPSPSPTPSPQPDPTPNPTTTPTTEPTATPPPAAVPAPEIVLSIQDRRPRLVTLRWSIDEPAGIADLVVVAVAPGGRRIATLGADRRSLTVPRPLDGPLAVVVAARNAAGDELGRSNRVMIPARR